MTNDDNNEVGDGEQLPPQDGTTLVKEEEEDDVFVRPQSKQAPLFVPDFDEDDEDVKPEGKPKLRVSYKGFS